MEEPQRALITQRRVLIFEAVGWAMGDVICFGFAMIDCKEISPGIVLVQMAALIAMFPCVTMFFKTLGRLEEGEDS